MQCLIMANMPTGGPKSQNNADSYVYFSVGEYTVLRAAYVAIHQHD